MMIYQYGTIKIEYLQQGLLLKFINNTNQNLAFDVAQVWRSYKLQTIFKSTDILNVVDVAEVILFSLSWHFIPCTGCAAVFTVSPRYSFTCSLYRFIIPCYFLTPAFTYCVYLFFPNLCICYYFFFPLCLYPCISNWWSLDIQIFSTSVLFTCFLYYFVI
jgi:hypothetical protein